MFAAGKAAVFFRIVSLFLIGRQIYIILFNAQIIPTKFQFLFQKIINEIR
jgi:hypothetical protein